MKTVIVGSGVSGQGAARLAEVLKLEAVVAADGDGSDPAAVMAEAELVVLSPGVRASSPLWQAAREEGVEVIGELEFAYRHFPNGFLAVTGTNGKTTTTELTVHLLAGVGAATVAAGNIGVSFSEVTAELLTGRLPAELLPVVEVSSFQLEHCVDFSPFAAVVLNLASDHLDRYPGGMAEYALVKERIFRHVAPENRIYGRSMGRGAEVLRVSCEGNQIRLDGKALFSYAETRLKGEHNLENLLAALELCSRVLYDETMASPEFKEAVCSFRPGAHRLELVAKRDGVTYINDSKATNPAAVAAALKALEGEVRGVVLLLGGLDKNMDFALLRDYRDFVRQAFVFGECRQKIIRALKGAVECHDYGTDFDGAVRAAVRAAHAGEAVLLSPGCASMDMFADYRARGEAFRKLVGG